MKIYLAGGMKGTWQDRIREVLPNHTCYDPRDHNLSNPVDYTKWDLDHVKKADLIFAVFTKDNPSGFGMSLEIGYAHALGIPIVLVDEQGSKSWAMAREMSNCWFKDLAHGILEVKFMLEGSND